MNSNTCPFLPKKNRYPVVDGRSLKTSDLIPPNPRRLSLLRKLGSDVIYEWSLLTRKMLQTWTKESVLFISPGSVYCGRLRGGVGWVKGVRVGWKAAWMNAKASLGQPAEMFDLRFRKHKACLHVFPAFITFWDTVAIPAGLPCRPTRLWVTRGVSVGLLGRQVTAPDNRPANTMKSEPLDV